MSFFDELEQAHSSLKHFGLANVDPNALRVLLRQAQVLATIFESHNDISFCRTTFGWELDLTANIDSDTKASLMYMMGET